MNEEEVAKVVKEELDSFKKGLGSFTTQEGLDKAFADFKKEMKIEDIASKQELQDLTDAVTKQGETLASMKVQAGERGKSLKMLLRENDESLKAFESGAQGTRLTLSCATKDVFMDSVADNTLAFRDNNVSQLYRGIPFLRNLFPSVSMGNNTNNTVRWWEQTAITNNAAPVNEKRSSLPAQSVITWAEKSLNGKWVQDSIKVGLDAIRDVDFINGEVQRLMTTNMLLKENEQLLTGSGVGDEMMGITKYATAFDTAIGDANKIVAANLIDFVGLSKTQINLLTKGGAMPNYWLGACRDIDAIRYKKDSEGQYIFPNWALGAPVSVGGAALVENALMPADSLLIGDFNQGTLYVWDDIVVDVFQEDTDRSKHMVTILVTKRENLRVTTEGKKAFVYTSTLANDINAITKALNA